MNLLKKLWANEEKRRQILFAVMTVVFTLTLYMGGTSRGFLSTFPIFFFSAVIVFLFYRNLKNSLIITLILSLALSLVDSTGYNSVVEDSPTLNLAGVKALFFVISAAAAYLCAGWLKQKNMLGRLKTVGVVLLYLVCFNAIFGNIFGAVKWHNATAEYLEEHYPLQEIESMTTAYDFKSHYYETMITFKEPRRSFYGEEKMVLADQYDGYFLYAKNAMFEIGQSIMTQALRDSGETMGFNAESLPFDENLERSMFDLGGDYGEVFPYLSYEVSLTDDIPDMTTFEAQCKAFMAALDGKFEYNRLVVYGGEKRGYLFQAEIRDGNLTVQEFDEAAYVDAHRKTVK